MIGAYLADSDGSDSGSAYLFKRTASDWFQAAKLTASDAAAGDHFGYAVAISREAALIGAELDDDNEKNSGSTYYYDLSNLQCDDLSLPDAAAYGKSQAAIKLMVTGFPIALPASQAIWPCPFRLMPRKYVIPLTAGRVT